MKIIQKIMGIQLFFHNNLINDVNDGTKYKISKENSFDDEFIFEKI